MSIEQIERLSSDVVQDYIFNHANEDEKKLLLKHKLILELPASLIAQQLAARKKAEFKIRFLHKIKGILYPSSLNLEQSSSEATARFKAEIIRGEIKVAKPQVADLSGGWGVDSFFFSGFSNKVDYVEPDLDLNKIVQHNFSSLKRTNVSFHQKTAEDFLKENSSSFDFIYLDPSRRDTKSRKIFALNDCAPNVVELLPDLLQRTDFVLVKASPLLDIKQGLRELTFVKAVIVVSVENECKEVLFLIEKSFSKEPIVKTFNLDQAGNVRQAFEFFPSEEESSISNFSAPHNYLYEPNASILKAGAFKLLGEKLRLKKIQFNTHFYTSTDLIKNFPGRIFEVIELDTSLKLLAGQYANIICRNYPISPEGLKKKLKTKDGGEKYVLAFSGINKKYMIVAKRLA